MSEINQLKPEPVWQWFDRICAIPHPSYHEAALAQYIVDWFTQKGLNVSQDTAGNVLICKSATPNMANRATVSLQAHLDMVPQKNADTEHDFLKDPIKPYINGEWVNARGTTLGADNGMGLASCLAILDSDDIEHPPLEVLLTVTEETGMVGAQELKPNWFNSRYMINTDTEETGEIYIGCAGGIDANISYPLSYDKLLGEKNIRLFIKGLRGGHSGCDIHTGRGNAIKILGRILSELNEALSFRLVTIEGGSVRNAIPREASAVLNLNDVTFNTLEGILPEILDAIRAIYAVSEPNMTVFFDVIQDSECIQSCFDEKTHQGVLSVLNALPNGVIRMSDVVDNVVESSLSLGLLEKQGDTLAFSLLIRSLLESGKKGVIQQLKALLNLTDATLEFDADYPGWTPDANSALLKLSQTCYEQIIGKSPDIKVIHAGLECGLIKKHYPDLDVISIGPTIRNAHSPDETVHIESVAIYWQVLLSILKNFPE